MTCQQALRRPLWTPSDNSLTLRVNASIEFRMPSQWTMPNATALRAAGTLETPRNQSLLLSRPFGIFSIGHDITIHTWSCHPEKEPVCLLESTRACHSSSSNGDEEPSARRRDEPTNGACRWKEQNKRGPLLSHQTPVTSLLWHCFEKFLRLHACWRLVLQHHNWIFTSGWFRG